jgi:aryl-alcohol dehydrogenase-like predicted oxidoreductase
VRNHAIMQVVLDEAGKLDISPIALALSWNLSRPGVVSPIIGPKSVKQLEDNLAALGVTLPVETVERIDAVSEPRFPYPHDFLRMARQMMTQMRGEARG